MLIAIIDIKNKGYGTKHLKNCGRLKKRTGTIGGEGNCTEKLH